MPDKDKDNENEEKSEMEEGTPDTEGDTEEEARALIEDAIRLHIEDRRACNEPIYEEVGATKVRVAV